MKKQATLLSERTRQLVVKLRDLAPMFSESQWSKLRKIANEAEDIADDLERAEGFELQILTASLDDRNTTTA